MKQVEIRDVGKTNEAFLQRFNLRALDDAVASFVLAPRFAAVAARLLGVPGGLRRRRSAKPRSSSLAKHPDRIGC